MWSDECYGDRHEDCNGFVVWEMEDGIWEEDNCECECHKEEE